MKLKQGQRVRIVNLDKLWSKQTELDEIDYWKYLVGKTVSVTGYTDDAFHHDDEWDYYNDRDGECDDDRTSERTYELNITDPDGDSTTIYMFAHNFEQLDVGPPKDDIEWLDRVQLNFKY